MFDDLLLWDAANLAGLSLLVIAALWLRYTARHDSLAAHVKLGDTTGVPSTFPYIFPLLGSLPVTYLWDPRAFVLNRKNFFQSAHPVLVKILTQEFYVIRGPENVKALFKNSWMCTSIPFVKFALGYAFGLPAKALSLYDKDDSGGGHVPHPGSNVEARNRIDYLVYQSLVRFLEGKGLSPFWNRFVDNITQQLHGLNDRIGSDWEYHADLMKVVGDETTVSIINAFCGPHLLRLNPHFLQDYWDFDRNLQTYLQGTALEEHRKRIPLTSSAGIPWFLAPRADAARKRVLNAVKIWQQHARDHFNDSAISADGDDPFWGSSFFRERQEIFLKWTVSTTLPSHPRILEQYGRELYCGLHLSFEPVSADIVYRARNSISAASWAIYDIYRDPEMLASVRAEVDACVLKSPDGRIRFDIDQLLRLPVLQAVYAETLRLRMHFYIIRMPDRVDINIRDWIIPRRKVIVTPTTVAHMDSGVWNTGLKNEHPVDKFWIGRFLKYPSTGDTGNTQPHNAISSSEFSTKGLEGSWIPYGGGPRQCPGRHFAKRQILLTIALMVSLFDCEILEEGKGVQEDFTLMGFGSGVSHPIGRVPMRIRRRSNSKM
ncbi:Cholesterol 7-alpha-monooxygenase [Cytospora mali]|uniref:Cholesterol 7-alpha-monooxygenase n=1 Tax=Cytospora mali TaxID=578113 RepID=A0A194V3B6_CYTMA|nr:Cholesterol 7-alpha-monooxygenase [Valsa mali var. pyri (nom. inval.)]